ncbi:hypothetical protein DDE82_001410 [Stemphylium lycopersici]|uniref:Uncharacterized protein n=1 Tax=Stemphylium lycopersici TaxID=183478 RepID=A0A364NER6_STELY|nr:hypothetical protein TW65_06725 [Stemphylium lycopersici]RAR10136.1 hypothetical protein DDE82_001410 [Stemphylium lycopersici]RAR15581.1 hypothetical protein DDE83_001031 [Stemphylium lycopersici]
MPTTKIPISKPKPIRRVGIQNMASRSMLRTTPLLQEHRKLSDELLAIAPRTMANERHEERSALACTLSLSAPNKHRNFNHGTRFCTRNANPMCTLPSILLASWSAYDPSPSAVPAGKGLEVDTFPTHDNM